MKIYLLLAYFLFGINNFMPVLLTGNLSGQKNFHDFHVSRSDLIYNAETRTLQTTLHIFIDDLELALQQAGADSLYLCTEKESSLSDGYIDNYLKQKFRLEADGSILEYNFLGKETSDDLSAVWCYLESEPLPPPNTIKLSNSILMEVYDDQKNIISIEIPGNEPAYFIFERGDSNASANFEHE